MGSNCVLPIAILLDFTALTVGVNIKPNIKSNAKIGFLKITNYMEKNGQGISYAHKLKIGRGKEQTTKN